MPSHPEIPEAMKEENEKLKEQIAAKKTTKISKKSE